MGHPPEVRPKDSVLHEVHWGIVRDDTGNVEFFGTKPSGDTGYFTEGEARYIANSQRKDKRVLRSEVTRTTTRTAWEEA